MCVLSNEFLASLTFQLRKKNKKKKTPTRAKKLKKIKEMNYNHTLKQKKKERQTHHDAIHNFVTFCFYLIRKC